MSATDDTGPASGCGNGIAEPDEDCDGRELASDTCDSFGFDGGTLACTDACAYDTTACRNLPAAPALVLAFSQVKQLDFSWSAVPGADQTRSPLGRFWRTAAPPE